MSRALEIMGEACAGLAMSTKRMFGGHGFFAPNGAMFAGIVTHDEIVVKLAPGDARDELIALGGHAWTYDGQNKPMTMQAWIVIPDSFYDDTETLHTWLERAYVMVPSKQRAPKKGAAPTTKAAVVAKTSGKTAAKAGTSANKTGSRKKATTIKANGRAQ